MSSRYMSFGHLPDIQLCFYDGVPLLTNLPCPSQKWRSSVQVLRRVGTDILQILGDCQVHFSRPSL